MEAQEEVMAAGSASSLSWDVELLVQPAVAKGKRTKRPRTSLQHQQRAPAATVCSAVDSPSASSAESFTEEDEDLAVCLILLARGRASSLPSEPSPHDAAAQGEAVVVVGSSVDKFVNRGADDAAEAATGAGGKLCVYECKTCNKCFPSFQALGGHRASHKRPKLTAAMAESTIAAASVGTDAAAAAAVDDKKLPSQADLLLRISTNPFSKSNLGGEIGSYGKVKIHECSICGSEFSSGQALGGHMRRHRPAAAAAIQESKKEDHPRSQLLSLDLNLPAPTDDHAAHSRPPSPAPFLFAAGERPLLFAASASALVDCHY